MKLIRRILFLLLLISLAVLVFQNQQSLGMPLEFAFLHWRFSLVLGFWILFAFAAGAALFTLIDAWKSMLLRLEIRRRDQEILRLRGLARDNTPSERSGPREFPDPFPDP